jgi:hypothetical protein
VQPTLPGPIADDFATWGAPPAAPEKPIGGSVKRAFDGKKLRVVSA